MKYYIADTKEALEHVVNKIKKEKKLAIDLECENNLHHYGVFSALIQISTPEDNFIIDVIKLKDIASLVKVFHDPSIEKIFHDVSFDFRILKLDFDCHPKNVFDTQLAAVFLGKKELSLSALLKEYFGIEKESKFQMADWTKRPIKENMLEYAINDTFYSIRLRDILAKELEALGRLDWVKEEFKEFEKVEWETKKSSFMDVRGQGDLNPQERAILKRLFKVREKLAKKVNKPAYFVMNNKKLITLSKEPPVSVEQWTRLREVHPIVKQRAKLFFQEVKAASSESIPIEKLFVKRFNEKQREKFRKLNLLKEKLSSDLNIPGHLIMSKDQAKEIVLTGSTKCLKNWQKEVIKHIKLD